MAVLVNEERIEANQMQAEAMRMQQERGEQPGPPSEALLAAARERLIRQALLRQEANAQAAAIEPLAIDAALDELMGRAGGKEAFLQRQRMTEADMPRIRAHVVERLRIEKLIDEHRGVIEEPGEDALQAYYDEKPARFRLGERVRASHIVKRPQGPDDGDTFEIMRGLRRRARDGEDFAALADEHSDCRTDPGGALGTIGRGQMVEAFEVVVFSLEPGEVSPVFQTQFGYHIALVHEREEPHQQTFAEAQEAIRRHLMGAQEEAHLTQYIEALKGQAQIREVEDPPAATPAGQGAGPGAGKGRKKGKGRRRKGR